MFVVIRIKTVESIAEVVYYELAPLGFDAIMEEESEYSENNSKDPTEKTIWITSVSEENYNETEVREILENYTSQNLLTYSISTEEKQNWNKKWEENFQPIRLEYGSDKGIEKKCIIRADFHEAEPDFEYEIIVTPKMSFGTGHHQTTRLMLGHQFEINHTNKKVLDAGSGTGILAIMAAKLGAKEVFACDIEDWSVENSLENAERNSIKIDSKHGTVKVFEGQKFDILLANINKNVLLEEMPLYAELLEKTGTLVLSGFHVKDVEDISERATEFGWHIQKQTEETPWCSLRLSLSVNHS
ncbi:50S ribosomal protein L11 methyltransferase [Bernardetia sp.]|uniref:50S ribosomal protein L11 methyltransferase n=1 Tax=Bernardetia sp. TaxID=1937974 RepID=UPI0025B94E3D|nr:50S ribosomal protein L11 methyltransferase [Bernardetia sp.]